MIKEASAMNRNSKPFLARAFLCAVFGVLVVIGLASCKPSGAEAKADNVDHYTCTMHPSVHSHEPGKCPICSMDLVPVLKKVGAGNPMNAMLGMAAGTNPEASPSEFTIPVKQQQQIGVTFGTVEKHRFSQAIRAAGTVAYDKRRQWEYVSRIGGYVQQLNIFSPGESVEKGAPLLTIYSPELYTAQKEFANALAMRDNARTNGSADVLSSAEQLVQAGAERLRLWGIGDDQITELEKTRKPRETLVLSSPFKGVVRELAIDQGSSVATGDRIVDVADLSSVWVWAQFYQDELPMLKKGLARHHHDVFLSRRKIQRQDRLSSIRSSTTPRGRAARGLMSKTPTSSCCPTCMWTSKLAMDMGEGLAVPVERRVAHGLAQHRFRGQGRGQVGAALCRTGPEIRRLLRSEIGLEGKRARRDQRQFPDRCRSESPGRVESHGEARLWKLQSTIPPRSASRSFSSASSRPARGMSFLVFILAFFGIAGGIWALMRTPLDAIPDLSDVQVIVYTDWEGRSPDLVEDQITYPISTRFIAAPKVKFVRGESMFGKSFVYVIFEDGTDIYWARSRVIEYLNSVRGSLPEGVNPVIGPDATGVGWVYEYALVDDSGKHDLAELRSLAGLASALRAGIGERRGRSRAGRRLREAIPGRSRSEQARRLRHPAQPTWSSAITREQRRRGRENFRGRDDRVLRARPRLHQKHRGHREHRRSRSRTARRST